MPNSASLRDRSLRPAGLLGSRSQRVSSTCGAVKNNDNNHNNTDEDNDNNMAPFSGTLANETVSYSPRFPGRKKSPLVQRNPLDPWKRFYPGVDIAVISK